jgi:mannose-6-phosphate isomerase-like protein (cupin superfamily)
MPDGVPFGTTRLPAAPDVVATDGSDVRVLLATRGGSMAHFTLAPGTTSIAVAHRTIDEVWLFLGGRGEMWRRLGEHEETVAVEPGVCVTIPVGTRFQYRALGPEPLTAVAVATPPWPGEGEAHAVEGTWPAPRP